MFEDIFQGIMFILFGIGLFAFGIVTTRQKIGNYDFYDGEVTFINPETRDIIVSYKVGEDVYSTSYHMHDLVDMPEVNLKVRVMTYAGNPQKVFNLLFQREMGRGTSGKHKYIDNNSSQNRRHLILGSILFIVGGIAMLLDGLNI
ncbi:MAG: hypothetical protein NC205_05725, partial [Prevotella sp.]|nr:hypothetical protein [Prevotella sp.]